MPLEIPASVATPLLGTLIRAGLEAADPARAIRRLVRRKGPRLQVGRRTYDLRRVQRVVAVGAGKASAHMAQALERAVGPRLTEGVVVVKAGHAVPTKRITVLEAGHPIPDRAGLNAADAIEQAVAACGADDLVFVLISGGASSLLPAPVADVTLAEVQQVTDALLRSGAPIQDMNCVRKHLSRLAGGRLAERTKARLLTVILSDVIGDDLATIGSGPTVPDPTTFRDAVAVLKRHRIWTATPPPVRSYFLRGCRGLEADTPKPGHPRFRRGQQVMVGNNAQAVSAIETVARRQGLRTIRLETPLVGEAAHVGRMFASLAHRLPDGAGLVRRPYCVIAGGEPTVTVTGRGRGGRAQEFAVAAALEIAGAPRVWVAAFGTDGTDGPTDVAGAVVSGATVNDARRRRINLHQALLRHDTYRVLHALKSHLVTGPTGTNVNDLYLLLAL